MERNSTTGGVLMRKSNRLFVCFLIIAFTLTLMTWTLGLYKNQSKQGIPLVSTVGVCYACYLVYCFICF